MTHTQTSVRAAVRRGALLLDSRVPGWHKRVSLDALNMRDGYRCAGAQAFGLHYTSAMRRLDLNINAGEPVEYGFNFLSPHPAINDRAWKWLHDAWVAEVTSRRNPVTVPVAPKPRKARVRKPRHTVSAKVAVTYAPGQNISVTRRGDVITKVTTWTTGVPGSTTRH